MEKMQSLGVFLASADKAGHEALSLVFKQQKGVRVVGNADNSNSLLQKIPESKADLLLIDWELPVWNDLSAPWSERVPALAVSDLIGELRAIMGHLQIVVLSIFPDMEMPALAAGADAFVCKTEPPEKLLADLLRLIS